METERDVQNYEKAHGCWYIENPISKELTKRIVVKLGVNCEQEFIIVVKPPKTSITEHIAAFVSFKLLTY